jgi:hypothetical protein
MTFLDEAIEAAQHFPWPNHFGPEAQENHQQRLMMMFDAIRETLNHDLQDLRRLNRLSTIAISCGLVFLTVAAGLLIGGVVNVGIAAGAVGLITESVPLLLFNRIEKTRESVAAQLPFYRQAYGLLVVLEQGKEKPEIWHDVVTRLGETLGNSAGSSLAADVVQRQPHPMPT